jgi:hypothetical protein
MPSAAQDICFVAQVIRCTLNPDGLDRIGVPEWQLSLSLPAFYDMDANA